MVDHDPNHADAVGEPAKSKPENVVFFNFDLGVNPVLMADGHREAVTFSARNDLTKEETLPSQPQ